MRAFLFAAVSERVNDSEKLNARGCSAVSKVPLWWDIRVVQGLFLPS